MRRPTLACDFCYSRPMSEDRRFCDRCGRPVRQPCPYECQAAEGGGALWVPLLDGTGPSFRCPQCHGLLRACPLCGRLYSSEVYRCEQPRCSGERLLDPPAPWACASGDPARRGWCPALPQVSRRSWSSSFSGPRPAELLSAYGDLVWLDQHFLRVVDEEGQSHQVVLPSSAPLEGGRIRPGSLLASHGALYALLESGLAVFEGTPPQVRSSHRGDFRHMAAAPDALWLLSAGPGTWTATRLQLPDQTEMEVSLDLAPGERLLNPLVVGERLVAVAASGEVRVVDSQGSCQSLPSPAAEETVVAAAAEGEMLVLLARGPAGWRIASLHLRDLARQEQRLSSAPLSWLALREGHAYLAAGSEWWTFRLADLREEPRQRRASGEAQSFVLSEDFGRVAALRSPDALAFHYGPLEGAERVWSSETYFRAPEEPPVWCLYGPNLAVAWTTNKEYRVTIHPSEEAQ